MTKQCNIWQLFCFLATVDEYEWIKTWVDICDNKVTFFYAAILHAISEFSSNLYWRIAICNSQFAKLQSLFSILMFHVYGIQLKHFQLQKNNENYFSLHTMLTWNFGVYSDVSTDKEHNRRISTSEKLQQNHLGRHFQINLVRTWRAQIVHEANIQLWCKLVRTFTRIRIPTQSKECK